MNDPTTLRDLVREHATATPDAPAIGAPGRAPLTYAGLARHIDDVGRALRAAGVARNDRVAIVLPNGPEMATAFVAIGAFATAAPLNPAYRDAEFDFFIGDLKPKILVVKRGLDSPSRAVAARHGVPVVELEPAADFAGRFTLAVDAPSSDAAPDPAEPSDVALVLHTSGTTSRPKIVPLAHANVTASATNIRRVLALEPRDRVLNVMPLYHIHGLIGAELSSLRAGASVHCSPGFDARRFFDWYDEIRPTWYSAVPTIHQAVLAAAAGHEALIASHRLRFVRSSSASLPPMVMAELERVLGAPAVEAYGMTEASHQMASNPLPPGARKPGSVGLPTIKVEIMGNDGALLPPNARGEIVISGKSVTRGYESNPAANATAFTNGWFRTGDEGYKDEDGYVFLSGRLKEIINKAGEKISPREIDEVLMAHAAVHQAVTFALPHPTLGEDVAAIVVLKPGAVADEDAIRQFAGERLSEFKVPQRVLIVAEAPKGPTGKMKRVGLHEHFAAELAAAPYVAPRTDVEEKLARVWAEELKVERVGVNDNYFVLGGDSLQAVMLGARAKQAGVPFTPNLLFAHPTIAGLAAALAAPAAAPSVATTTARDDAAIVEAAKAAGVAPADIEDAYPTLPFQHGLVSRYEPRLSPSSLVTTWVLEGPLDDAALDRAFQRVVDRRPILRTGFVKSGPRDTTQIVLARVTASVERHDVAHLEGAAQGAEREAIVAAAHVKPFSLVAPPLVRLVLLRLGADRHQLSIVWFHAIADLWSVGLVERELAAVYDEEVRAAPTTAAPTTSFHAFVDTARARVDAAEQRAFWAAQLSGTSDAKLDAFSQDPRGGLRLPSAAREVVSRSIDQATVQALTTWCRQHAVTLSTLLHGAWALVAGHYVRTDDVVFGVVLSGRWGEVGGVDAIVGPTLGAVLLRVRLQQQEALAPWLLDVQARFADMQRFTHTRWEVIAGSFVPPRRNVPAWSTLVVENLPPELWERPSTALRFTRFEHRTRMLPPLLISVFPVPGWHVKATFDPRLVPQADAEMLLDGYLGVLTAVLATSPRTLGDVLGKLDPSARRWR
ncbi:MAG TPA: AMP-binding protein [Byssovorax sp.]|jgi:acyl-CoA synthetase (AMP-forming)/AMP-acid ligase II/aryl carrier-like protein